MVCEIYVPRTMTILLKYLSFHSCIYDVTFPYFTMCEVLNIKYVLKMLHDKTADL
jgi:hypothetical protein